MADGDRWWQTKNATFHRKTQPFIVKPRRFTQTHSNHSINYKSSFAQWTSTHSLLSHSVAAADMRTSISSTATARVVSIISDFLRTQHPDVLDPNSYRAWKLAATLGPHPLASAEFRHTCATVLNLMLRQIREKGGVALLQNSRRTIAQYRLARRIIKATICKWSS